MTRVKLTWLALDKIRDWCDLVHENRAARDAKNNDNHTKRIDREIVGKIGELVTACFLDLRKMVDWGIHVKGKVDFTGDLGEFIHVKTCAMDAKGATADSWLVDISDKIYTSPRPEDLIYLAYADISGECEVIGYVTAEEVYRIWKPSLKLAHKWAIYKDDIIHLIKPIEIKNTLNDKFFRSI